MDGALNGWIYSYSHDFETRKTVFDAYFLADQSLEYKELADKKDLRLRVTYKHGEVMTSPLTGRLHISSGGFY